MLSIIPFFPSTSLNQRQYGVDKSCYDEYQAFLHFSSLLTQIHSAELSKDKWYIKYNLVIQYNHSYVMNKY